MAKNMVDPIRMERVPSRLNLISPIYKGEDIEQSNLSQKDLWDLAKRIQKPLSRLESNDTSHS